MIFSFKLQSAEGAYFWFRNDSSFRQVAKSSQSSVLGFPNGNVDFAWNNVDPISLQVLVVKKKSGVEFFLRNEATGKTPEGSKTHDHLSGCQGETFKWNKE